MQFKQLFKRSLLESTDKLPIQLFRYTFVGGLAFLVDYLLLYFLTEYMHFYYLFSATISFLTGLFVNYRLSRSWIFRQSKFENKGIEFLLFTAVGITGLLLNNLIIWAITTHLSIYYMYSKLVSAVVVYLWNFLARKYWVFKK